MSWRYVPGDLPPGWAIYQQTQRWTRAGCFEAIVHDLRMLLRRAEGRAADPTAAVFDARTVQSTPESGATAGYDGHKRRKGSKVHMAVETLGHLLPLHVTPANEQERSQVEALAAAVLEATGESVELASVDSAHAGEGAEAAAAEHGIQLEVIKHTEASCHRAPGALPGRSDAESKPIRDTVDPEGSGPNTSESVGAAPGSSAQLTTAVLLGKPRLVQLLRL